MIPRQCYLIGIISYPNVLVFEKAVTRMMDEGLTVDVIYLDFAKAFDSVNHKFHHVMD